MVVRPLRRAPLLLPALAVIAGLCLERLVGFQQGELAFAVLSLAATAALAAWRRARTLSHVALLLAALFGGAWWAVLRYPGPPPLIDAAPRETVLLEGCVVEPPRLAPEREQFTLELAPQARVRVNLFPKPGETLPALRYGERVEVEARIRPVRNFGNPGAFDIAAFLSRRHIYWTATAGSSSKVKRLAGSCGSPLLAAVYRWREHGLARLERLYASYPYVHGVSRALLLGDNARLEEVWKDTYRRTGTYHALVISGLHVGVLAAFLMGILRLANLPAPIVLALCSLIAWLYAILTGWNTPVVRAATALTLCLAARLLYRRQQLLNSLAFTALLFIAFDPRQVFDSSFQLSFLAVGAIAALALPLSERYLEPYRNAIRRLNEVRADHRFAPSLMSFRLELRLLAETLHLWLRLPLPVCLAAIQACVWLSCRLLQLILISACVQLGLALPMMLYFHRVSVTGLVANVIAVPALGLIVPLGFVVLLTEWSWPAAGLKWLLEAVRSVLEWHAAWEPAWRVPDPPLWLSVSIVASLLITAALLPRQTRWRHPALAAFAALIALAIAHPFPPQLVPGSLEVTAIDVGQGDSILVAFPDGSLMLVDGGGYPSFGLNRKPAFDVGEEVIAPYLWSRSIRRLDVVVMTHPDSDHHGGLPALIADFRPSELWIGDRPPDQDWEEVRAAALAAGARIVSLSAGDSRAFGRAQVAVLAPVADAPPATANDQSLVLHVAFGKRSFLLTGDMERKMERQLLAQGHLPSADVLKVAHHGSRTSTTEEFLEALSPRFAIISCGFANMYRHPHPEVMERLASRRAAVFRTDEWGLVTFLTDGETLRVEGGPWRVATRRLLFRD